MDRTSWQHRGLAEEVTHLSGVCGRGEGEKRKKGERRGGEERRGRRKHNVTEYALQRHVALCPTSQTGF